MLNIVISLRTGIHSSNISLQMDERFLRKLFTTPVKDLPFFCSRKNYFVTTLQNDLLCKRFTSFNPVANKRRLLFCRIVGQSLLLFDSWARSVAVYGGNSASLRRDVKRLWFVARNIFHCRLLASRSRFVLEFQIVCSSNWHTYIKRFWGK